MPHLHELADAVSALGLDVLISKVNIGCVWHDTFHVVYGKNKVSAFDKYEGTNSIGALVSRKEITRLDPPPIADELERCAYDVLLNMSGKDVFWSLPKRKTQTALGFNEVFEVVHVKIPEFSSAEEMKLKLELMR